MAKNVAYVLVDGINWMAAWPALSMLTPRSKVPVTNMTKMATSTVTTDPRAV